MKNGLIASPFSFIWRWDESVANLSLFAKISEFYRDKAALVSAKKATAGRRVGVIWDATIAPYRVSQEMGTAARLLDVEVVGLEVRELADINCAIVDATKAPIGGPIVASTPMTGRYRTEIAEIIKAHRLRSIAAVDRCL